MRLKSQYTIMKKLLMHKDTIVATFNLSKNNRISSVQVENEALFPAIGDSEINSIRRWIIARKTALNRQDLAPIIGFYGTSHFVSHSLRSLTDCYWVKDSNANATWEEISAYHMDDLEDDSIFLAVNKPKDFESFENDSPNLTIAGKNQVFWYRNEDLGLLNTDAQTDMNIYKIARENNISIFSPRKYIVLAGNIYTFKKSNTSELVERIPFDQLYFSVEDYQLSKSENFKRCCEIYKIPDWKNYICNVIKFNKIHPQKKIDLLDLGVLRNAETLEYQKFDEL